MQKSDEIKILLVDDHAILRDGLKMLLNNETGFEVVGEAGNAVEAIDEFDNVGPDLVVLDLSLPDKNGLKVLKEIKNKSSKVKVIVLTMHEDEEYLQKVLELGGDGYILKKAADSELISAVRSVYSNEGVFIDSYLAKSLFVSDPEDYGENIKIGDELLKDKLSPRELDILKLVALGYTNKDIAENLVISVKTVETHKGKIKDKLNIGKTSEMVKFAFKNGIVEIEEAY
ncbi:response regulator [Natranaerofaba carboxydovora]|uniref:response regulator n=1 Tax=Natranaerofaba carboxydovora TaxID=2742683 RepID=UPI001F149211|nr:response regulator transcription factor [Natranaerofaba carboxydovora]UMZ73166.1 Oxygen regulatory protein NreC [Natranaerofaba carboxydovora]